MNILVNYKVIVSFSLILLKHLLDTIMLKCVVIFKVSLYNYHGDQVYHSRSITITNRLKVSFNNSVIAHIANNVPFRLVVVVKLTKSNNRIKCCIDRDLFSVVKLLG